MRLTKVNESKRAPGIERRRDEVLRWAAEIRVLLNSVPALSPAGRRLGVRLIAAFEREADRLAHGR